MLYGMRSNWTGLSGGVKKWPVLTIAPANDRSHKPGFSRHRPRLLRVHKTEQTETGPSVSIYGSCLVLRVIFSKSYGVIRDLHVCNLSVKFLGTGVQEREAAQQLFRGADDIAYLISILICLIPYLDMRTALT